MSYLYNLAALSTFKEPVFFGNLVPKDLSLSPVKRTISKIRGIFEYNATALAVDST